MLWTTLYRGSNSSSGIIKSHDKILTYYSLMCEILQFLTVWKWFTRTSTKKAEIH